MTGSASSFFRMFALPFCVLAVGLALPGVADAAVLVVEPEKTPGQIRAERARNRLADAQASPLDDPSGPPPIDPALVEFFRATVTELAGPEYEGRAPGSVGIDRAASHIEDHFRSLGFQPAFSTTETAADGTEVLTPRSAFRQSFSVGQETRAGTTVMTVGDQPLIHGQDFSALAFSGSAQVTAPVAFAGYAITAGPDGYSGFDPATRFDDKIVIALAYQPMDEQGISLWQENTYTNRTRLSSKAGALIHRGAKAVLIVKPPQAQDERVHVLETVDSTRPGQSGFGSRGPRLDAPVVQITPEVAQRILDRGNDPSLTLASLVERANAGPIVMDLPVEPVSIGIKMESIPIEAFNVGAVLPGVGTLADEFVVIGAHYDHVGFGGIGAFPGNSGKLHSGADDNASGTAGMMLAAQSIAERVRTLPPNHPRRSFLFLAFSAEEMGLLGSIHYTKEPIAPINRHSLMLNLDMIGTLDDEPLEIGNIRSSPDMPAFVEPHFERSGLLIARQTSVGNDRSDHASFDAVGVPNLFFFTGLHPRYHRPQDTVDFIDFEGGVRISLLATDIAMDAATPAVAVFHRQAGSSGAAGGAAGRPSLPGEPTVRIGLLPTNSTKGGILVQRVFPNTSASDAGIRPDDRLLTWNGTPLRSVEDLRPRLAEHKPGDVVRITLERGDETIEVDVTLRGIE